MVSMMVRVYQVKPEFVEFVKGFASQVLRYQSTSISRLCLVDSLMVMEIPL